MRTEQSARGLRRETKSLPPKKPPAPSVKTRPPCPLMTH